MDNIQEMILLHAVLESQGQLKVLTRVFGHFELLEGWQSPHEIHILVHPMQEYQPVNCQQWAPNHQNVSHLVDWNISFPFS